METYSHATKQLRHVGLIVPLAGIFGAHACFVKIVLEAPLAGGVQGEEEKGEMNGVCCLEKH